MELLTFKTFFVGGGGGGVSRLKSTIGYFHISSNNYILNIISFYFVLLYCNRSIDQTSMHAKNKKSGHMTSSRAVLFLHSLHAITSSVIYYNTDIPKNELHLLPPFAIEHELCIFYMFVLYYET